MREVPAWPASALSRRRSATTRASAPSATEVLAHVDAGRPLVDVRSPEEFTGERLHMPAYPNEGALRGGHIPGAKSVPWARAIVPETGEFRTAAELAQIYFDEQRLPREDEIVAYCRIGERSSHTWFVLTYLLGPSEGAQLRRQLDRVGQSGGRAD